jgi:hypothetical protein
MPDRKDRFWQMVSDLVREAPPVLRCCLLLGCGVGLGGAIWVIVRMISTGVITISWGRRYDDKGICYLILLGGTIGGLFAGLVLGVVIELILEHLFGIKFDIPEAKRRKKREK